MKHLFQSRHLSLNYPTSTSESTKVAQTHLKQRHQADEGPRTSTLPVNLISF